MADPRTFRFTQDMIAELKIMWSNGLSYSQIGVELHRLFPEYIGELKRNNISGMLNRLRKHSEHAVAFSPRPRSGGRTGGKKGRTCKPKRPRRTPEFTKRPVHAQNKMRGGDWHADWTQTKAGDAAAPQHFEEAFVAKQNQKPKSLMELQDDECRWPVDTKDKSVMMFCGCKISQRGPYCNDHSGR